MPKPFDATTKYLEETRPKDWLELSGLTIQGDVEFIDADLATVTADADRVLRVQETAPWLAHIELQASYDRHLPERTLRYNVLLHGRHELPVRSIVILLRPEADGSEMTGTVEHRMPYGHQYLDFDYQVLRVWQQPIEDVLVGGIGTLPLAPLADVRPDALSSVIRSMESRIGRELSQPDGAVLWSATYVLMGLRYSAEMAGQLLRGVRDMKESVTYQAIVAEGEAKGRAEEARELLLSLGQQRLGPPDASTISNINRITSAARLDAMAKRILEVESWSELLEKR